MGIIGSSRRGLLLLAYELLRSLKSYVSFCSGLISLVISFPPVGFVFSFIFCSL